MPELPPAARLASPPAGGPSGRRPFTRAEYRYLARHYAHEPAAACARALGRTVGSVYHFLARHPELRKQGRP